MAMRRPTTPACAARHSREAAAAGGTVLNYATVETLLRNHRQVHGVQVRDEVSGAVAVLSACVVVNATGVWADPSARPRSAWRRGSARCAWAAT